jgi:hydrogenase maturation protein HypF
VVLPRLAGAQVSAQVAPGNDTLGVMLPYTPLHYLLFSDSPQADSEFPALVMTSGNLSEEPIVVSNTEALRQLDLVADSFLLHNRDIWTRVDDSVVRSFEGRERVLRRSRGFVPQTIDLGIELDEVLAYGGELKNTFCLTKGRFAILSQHIGDLENYETMQFFQETLARMQHLFRVSPRAVAYDLHPAYWSTRLALADAVPRKIGVQHHHAHIAGCMAEHGLTGAAIGLALDGTGYGTDGKIWGGEVLVSRLDGFERFAHLEYVPMPGGDAAVREPWRMALGALHTAGFDVESEQVLNLLGAQPSEVRVLRRMMERGINSPLTSSLGRLFDAVAALVLNRRVVDYEAQAAIELEGTAVDEPDRYEQGNYVPELHEAEEGSGSAAVIRTGKMWKAVLDDLWRGVPAKRIGARFHAGVAEGFINAAANARIRTDINTIALSGGCMHNRRLARLLRSGLEEEGFEVFMHRQVSPGDGGLSYGQVVIAAAMLRKSKLAGEPH